MNMSESSNTTFSPFWPLCLMALSLVIFLGWQVNAGLQQYRAALRMVDQQAVLANQAAQTESKLQAMMTDLLLLAKTDAEAQAIVVKYSIKMNTDKPNTGLPRTATLPAGGASSPTPAPRAPDATK